uniref:Uncharacterized protein n=1 Tax=Setaria italica TaxID=4555 RepID=K4AHG6_SETIT
MPVYYQFVFIFAPNQCHHCCFSNTGNTHWCRDKFYFILNQDAAAGGSTMEMRMHIIQFFFGRTCEYWLQMLLCKRSQDS